MADERARFAMPYRGTGVRHVEKRPAREIGLVVVLAAAWLGGGAVARGDSEGSPGGADAGPGGPVAPEATRTPSRMLSRIAPMSCALQGSPPAAPVPPSPPLPVIAVWYSSDRRRVGRRSRPSRPHSRHPCHLRPRRRAMARAPPSDPWRSDAGNARNARAARFVCNALRRWPIFSGRLRPGGERSVATRSCP